MDNELELKNLLELYFDVKDLYILTERLYQKYPVTLKNEINNAFDHLMRGLKASDNLELYKSEIDSSARHLKRAGYDCCELIFLYYSKDIDSIIERYSIENISAIYPNFYTEDLKLINKLKNKIQIISAEKSHERSIIYKAESYDEFKDVIKDTSNIYETIYSSVPSFESYKSKEKKQKFEKVILNIFIGVIGALIGAIISAIILD